MFYSHLFLADVTTNGHWTHNVCFLFAIPSQTVPASSQIHLLVCGFILRVSETSKMSTSCLARTPLCLPLRKCDRFCWFVVPFSSGRDLYRPICIYVYWLRPRPREIDKKAIINVISLIVISGNKCYGWSILNCCPRRRRSTFLIIRRIFLNKIRLWMWELSDGILLFLSFMIHWIK